MNTTANYGFPTPTFSTDVGSNAANEFANAMNSAANAVANAIANAGSLAFITGTAGEVLTAYQVCYLKSDGKYWKANATANTTMPAIVMANANISANANGTFIRRGPVINANWAWGTIGGFLYGSTTAGSLSQTAPGSNNQLQVLGVATAANAIDFDPQLILIEVV